MTLEILPTPKSHVPSVYQSSILPDRNLTERSQNRRVCRGYNRARVRVLSKDLGELILPDDEVRNAQSPEDTLLDFLQTTYETAAALAEMGSRLRYL